MNCHRGWRRLTFFTIHLSDVYRAHAFHLQRDVNMIGNYAGYAACNYPEPH